MEVAEVVYRVTGTMDASEKFGLVGQMRRSAVSIPSNVAEGYARQATADFIRFLRIARGSLAELSTQYEIACRVGLSIEDAEVTALFAEEARILGGLIRSLEQRETAS